jgi:hypothetical protein
MTKNAVGCKEISVADYLEIIENHPDLKEKLNDLGINLDKEGLSIPLNYSDLLTEEERVFLKKLSDKFNAKYEGDTIWHLKFGDEPESRRYCETDVICDYCYQSLLKIREHKDYMKP